MASRIHGARVAAVERSDGLMVYDLPSDGGALRELLRDLSPAGGGAVHRWAPRAVTLDGGAQSVYLADAPARPWDHVRHPDEDSAAMRRCESASVCGLLGGRVPVVWPVRCGRPVCPVCVAARAARRVHPIVPMVEVWSRGRSLLHLTCTLRAVPRGRPLLTPYEHLRSGHEGEPVEVGAACGDGPTMREALGRVGELWRSVRQGTGYAPAATGRWWRETTAACLVAREVTGRTPSAIPWRVRWHGHAHVVVAVEREALAGCTVERDAAGLHLVGPWTDRWVRSWSGAVRRSGGEAIAAAQRVGVVRLDDEGGADVARAAIQQVCKYPAKISTLTTAQAAEVAVSMYGLRPATVGGYLHAASRPVRDWRALSEDHRAADEWPEDRIALAETAGAALAARLAEDRDASMVWRPSDGWVAGPAGCAWVPLTVEWLQAAAAVGAEVQLARSQAGAESWRDGATRLAGVWEGLGVESFIVGDEAYESPDECGPVEGAP